MLKYYFIATFLDGTSFSQNEDDVSVLTENKKGSSFTDLLHLINNEGKKLEKFELVPVDQGGDHFLVDLETGHFEINHVPFFSHYRERAITKDLQLIFYRPTREHLHVNFSDNTATASKDKFYCIGWQGNLPDGSKIERTIVVE